MSTDPALGDYVPEAGKGNAKDSANLSGMGGVYNVVNFNLYHCGANNPVKYVDPDGRVAVADDAAEIVFVGIAIGATIAYMQTDAYKESSQNLSDAISYGIDDAKNNISNLFSSKKKFDYLSAAEPTEKDFNYLSSLTDKEKKSLTEKMNKDIERIQSKNRGNKSTVQYALVASHDGQYPNVRGGTTFLRRDDVWKYGQTSDLENRYSKTDLAITYGGVFLILNFMEQKKNV